MEDEDSGDLTDESYYEPPPPKKETKSATTTTDDLAMYTLKVDTVNNRDGRGLGGGEPGGLGKTIQTPQFLDLLSHEIYVQVMQTAGAIPRGKAFKTMTDEAAHESIRRWYKTAVTRKLQEEKSERSPEVLAQRKLSRRLRKQSTNQEEPGKQKQVDAKTPEEGATEEKDDSFSDSSEDEAAKAEKLIAEESGKQAIQMISEELISRVRMMRARPTPGVDDSDNESSETK